MQVGFIGLGKMGGRMVTKLISEGHEVVAWNRTLEASNDLKIRNPQLIIAEDIENLVKSLDKPRVIWIMVTHLGVDEVLSEVRKYLSEGDVVIDAGNSNFKETDRRFVEFEKVGINYLGIGTSGGILAAENGFPFMVGGSEKGYELIKPVLDSLSKPNGGHEFFGKGGAGHFVKMVHNGIEYGQMQAMAEGFELLEKSDYKFDLVKIASLYQKGTIVSGFLIDRLKDAFSKNSSLSDSEGPVAASGEAEWTIEAAHGLGLDLEIIDESLEFRQKSQTDEKIQNSFTARVVNALRREFGGHEVKKNE
jgi:6-phosphogluconate dehydrogenase